MGTSPPGYTRFALVSHVLPPSWSGQAMVIARLLRGLEAERYCLLSRQSYADSSPEDSSGLMPGRYYHLPPELQFTRGTRWGLARLRQWINLPLSVFVRALRIARILRREGCRAVVACTGDLADLPASYLASRLLGLPFYPYLFDDYTYQWTDPFMRASAQRLEPLLFRGASGVIVPNEFLRDEMRRRHAVEATVVHNPCETIADAPAPWPAREGAIEIVYTGAVYHANHDAFQHLIAALREIARPEVRLHIYTAQSPAELERVGIAGPVVAHNHLPPERALQVQREADILFLPLAFQSPIPEVIKTSAPGKLGEYLASGRPILACVPEGSFVSWYFKTYEVGQLVERPDPTALTQAVRQIVAEPGLRQKWCTHALARARADFDRIEAQTSLLRLLQGGA